VTREARLHAIAWGAALLSWLVWDRFGQVLAMDVEALIENLVRDWTTDYDQAPYARTDFIGPFRIAVRFGPVPLLLITVAGTLYRLTAGEEGSHPLSRLSARGKILVTVLSLGPFAAAAFPLGLGLSMWTAVELYWWLEWYGDMDPTMAWIHQYAPWLLLPGIVTAGIAGLVFALSESPDPVLEKQRRRSRTRRLLRVLAAVPLAVLTAASLFGAAHASRVSNVGAEVHAEWCGRCHERALPLYYIKTPDAWERTVATHVDIERVELTPQERARLLQFLTSNRSFSDHWTFRTRCQGCHGSTWRAWEPRSADDWQGIVKRMGWWSPYFYRADVGAQITRFVAEAGLVEESGGLLDLSPAEATKVRDVVTYCGFCHSVTYQAERYAREDPAEVRRMVVRMNDKIHLGLQMDDATLERITADYVELIQDLDRWDRLVPHDRPELGTGRIPGQKFGVRPAGAGRY
jgi:cytochrome c553